VEVADKLQSLSFNGNIFLVLEQRYNVTMFYHHELHLSFWQICPADNILEHINLPRGAGITQRFKQDCAQNVRQGLLQNSNRAPGEPYSETTRRPTGSVWRSLWLTLLVIVPLLILVGVWRSLNYWLV
jgi:hypothetical protein